MSKKISLAVSGAVCALLLSACVSGTSSLGDVEYALNDATAEPSVAFETPFTADGTQTHLIEEGTGADIAEGDEVMLSASIFSGTDGSSQGSTYTADTPDIVVPITENLKNSAPEIYEILTSNKVGMSFSYATNLTQTSATSSPEQASQGTPTNVEIYTVQKKLPKTVSGTQIPQDEINPAVESFSLSPEDGTANLSLAEDRGDPPTELVSQDLITGDGKTIEETDTVYVRYQGVNWNSGEPIDGNYGNNRYAATFALSQQTIEGWKQGLVGKTVGSRVLLIIPADLAYGETPEQEGAPAGSLVFVVDIIDAAAGAGNASASPEATDTASTEPTGESTGSSSGAETDTGTE